MNVYFLQVLSILLPLKKIACISAQKMFSSNNFYRCTVHSDIHTVHSPTDAHLLKL